jgi:hypothetical protein
LANEPESFDALVSRDTLEALGWLRNASTRYKGSERYPVVGTISRQFLDADRRTSDTRELEKPLAIQDRLKLGYPGEPPGQTEPAKLRAEQGGISFRPPWLAASGTAGRYPTLHLTQP